MKFYLIQLIFILLPLGASSQKIVLGSCVTHDKGLYQGEMLGGKPHGKGSTRFDNGDTFEGEYVKGKRQGHILLLQQQPL